MIKVKKPTGRPPKNKSPQELEEVLIKSRLENKDFKCEKTLVDYVVDNINNFCLDVLCDELISFKKEFQFQKQYRLSPRTSRVDLYVKCKKFNYLIEFKNPLHAAENRKAIGQLLDYGREYLDSKKRMLLITTKFDLNTAKTIKHYNLPIRYLYFDKNKMMEYLRDD